MDKINISNVDSNQISFDGQHQFYNNNNDNNNSNNNKNNKVINHKQLPITDSRETLNLSHENISNISKNSHDNENDNKHSH